MKSNADIRRTIMANTNDPEMCFIKAIRDYLKSEYGIPINELNNVRKKKIYCMEKTPSDFRNMVYTASKKSGYGF
jgi:hypothetical protein